MDKFIIISWFLIGFLSGLSILIYLVRGEKYNEESYEDNIFILLVATVLGYIVPIVSFFTFLTFKLSPILTKLLYKLVNIGIKKK